MLDVETALGGMAGGEAPGMATLMFPGNRKWSAKIGVPAASCMLPIKVVGSSVGRRQERRW